jgi:Bacterial Ig-like domain
MKRRAIVAVLFVVALVALVLVRSGGGDRQEAETTEGKPFKGESGVTRNVAWITARQRQLDRHPAAESRAADREAAAEEAAREAAVEPADTDVREKPEPGEEGTAPKALAPAARQERTGKAAIEPASSLTADTSFLGAETSESNFIPPDSMGSVGPTQILVAVNGRFKVFDKNGNPGSLNVDDSAFWAPVSNGSEPTDPGVEYDRLSGRWIVSAINTESTNNRVMLAVSSGPTISSTSSFTYFFFNEASPPPSGPARFADFPQLGVDKNAIYFGVNEFTSSSGGFTGTSAFVIRKSSVTGGGPIVVTAFRNLALGVGGAGPESPQPATDMDPNVDEGYIVGPDNAVFNRIDVRRITDPAGAPSISGNLIVTVPSTSAPLSVPAQGTSGGLDALDDRLFEAMVARGPSGAVSLWTAHNITVNSSGVGTGVGDRDGARWYQLGNLGSNPPSLIQSGTLFDTAASNPRFFWMPSIAMNGQGHASLNTSTAGVGRRAEVAGSGQLATDPLGTTEAFDLLQSSTFSYNLGSGSPKRWGDYSQTVVDPTDNMTFWTFQEYANATNSWGVRVIKLQPPPPATASNATPGTVEVGHCSVSVDVTGTSVNGSGFFDPGPDPGGPGYASHLTATVTGSVVVNGVTFTDPTHLTLDLDTRAATSGPKDVTITNPDGQSETATGLITIAPAGSTPSPPCLNGTDPDSPANDNAPKVFGSAPAATTVNLYSDPSCTGMAVGTGTAAEFAFPGISVTPPVADDSVTHFYATATAGVNVSACSSTLSTPSASVTYVEDSTPPVPSVDGGPSGLTNDNTPTFSFSATDAVGPVGFECSIDTGTPNFGSCSGPGNTDTPTSPLADGSYTFRVKATDAASNSAIATRTFQVDATAPSVSIDSGPSGVTGDRSPTFTFSATDAVGPVTFLCSIDSGSASFRGCSGPGNSDKPSSPLPFGSFTFRVRGTDGGGNSATATRSFTVNGPPETTITKGPKKTRKRRPKFTFAASETGTSFRCQVDQRKPVSCASPFRPPKLKPGRHVLKVQAIDAFGNVDASPAVKKFRVLPPS